MTDPAEKPAIARNVLTNAALIRLTDWARQNVEACQTLSNKTLATMAGETLNLHLTAANIASALEAVNITKIKPKAPPTIEERVTKLEFDTDAYLAAYGAQLNALEKQMCKLETESAAVTSRLLRALENIGAIQPPTSSEMVFDINPPGPPKPENMATYLSHDETKIIPSPDGRYIISTDGPITVTPPMLRPGETLHDLPDLDTAVAEVKGERERNESPWEGPTLAEPQPIHQAADAIGGEP